MRLKTIAGIILIVISMVLSSGCTDPINDNNNSTSNNNDSSSVNITIMNLNLSTVALTKSDVNLNQSHSKHLTEPYEFTNAAGFGKIWNVLEQYQSSFTTGLVATPTDPKRSVTQILTKLNSTEKAEEYMSLKIINLVDENGYTELESEGVGNESFYLVKDIPINNSGFDQYICYFSLDNLIITVGGVTTDSSEIIGYASLLEQKINDAIS